MKDCVKCGKKILDTTIYCPYCGKKQEPEPEKEPEAVKEPKPEKEPEAVKEPEKEPEPEKESEPVKEPEPAKPQEDSGTSKQEKRKIEYPAGLLMLISVIAGCIFGIKIFKYFPYLSYSSAIDNLWGIVMIAACAWSTMLLFVIALRCQKEYGRHLAYALFAGLALVCIMQFIENQRVGRYYGSFLSDYYPIAECAVTGALIWYLMKKENMILPEEECGNFTDVVKEIPEILHHILLAAKIKKNEREKEKQEEEAPIEFKGKQKKLWMLGKSNLYLVFCLAFSGELFFRLVSNFTFWALAANLLPILMCAGFWMIYAGCKKGRLESEGYFLIKGVFTFKMVLWILLAVLAGVLMLAAGIGIGYVLMVILLFGLIIGYRKSLTKMIGEMEGISQGKGNADFFSPGYISFVLVVNVIVKGIGFAWESYMQSTANSAVNAINQYGNNTSALAANILSQLGLSYNYGYGYFSSVIGSYTQPITDWIEENFGYGKSVFEMLLSLAVMILEIMLLSQIRANKNTR